MMFVCWLVNVPATCSVFQGRICPDNYTCYHTETEVADQTFYLTQSQYIDTGPTSPSADPVTLDAWQGSHWRANFEVTGMTRPGKIPTGINPRSASLETDTFTIRPMRRSGRQRDRDRDSESEREREREREGGRQTDRQKDRDTDRDRHRQRQRQREYEKDRRETESKTGR